MPELQWTAEEFRSALAEVRLTSINTRVLQAFLDAPDHTHTAHSLADAAQLQGGWPSANLRIGDLARRFQGALGLLPAVHDGKPHWWRYISTGVWEGGRFYWTLRPELRDALLVSGWQINRS